MAIATELKEVEVQFVSYVEEGANRKKFFLIKDKNKKEPNVETKVRVLINKENKEEDNKPHLIYGVVYEPLVVDTDGDFMREKEIKKTAHNFLKNYRLVDKDHNNIPGAGEVVESYVLLDDMEQDEETIKKGSWVLVTQPDDETWELIKDGKYSGYSLFGYAKEKIENTKVKNNTSIGIWDSVKKVFGIKKDFTTELENYRNNDFWYLFEIFKNAIWKIDWNVEGTEYKDKILNNLQQLTKEIESMTFEIQENAVKKSNSSNKNKKNNNNENNDNESNEINNSQGELKMNEKLKKEVKSLVEEVVANAIKTSKETEDEEIKDNKKNEENLELSEKIKILTEKVDNLEKSKENDSENEKNEKIDMEKLEKSLNEARERLDGVEEAMTNIPEYKVEKENEEDKDKDDDKKETKKNKCSEFKVSKII